MFARSTNQSLSFDPPVIVGSPLNIPANCGTGQADAGQFADPFVGADGSVYVLWIGWQLVDTPNCVWVGGINLVKSIDGGATWTPRRIIRPTQGDWGLVDGGVDVYNEPIATADIFGGPFNGNLYMVYANQDTANTAFYDYNVEFTRSVDGGVTWSDPIFVNDDYTGPGAMYDQFHPWLFINEDGLLVSIFYDQRTDPINHYKFDVFASYSFDGGETFTTNHRISDISINPTWLAKSPPPLPNPSGNPLMLPLSPMAGKIAEYIGVTAFHDKITAVWTDTRNGNQDVFGANWHLPFMEPRLLSPIRGAVVTTKKPTFTWATGWKNNDDRYRIEISTDSLFGSILYSTTNDTTSWTLTSESLDNGTYFWRAKGFRISVGDSTIYSPVGKFQVSTYICGDANGNGAVNLLDITYLINFLYRSGPPPNPTQAADVNHSGSVNVLDITYLINFLYKSGPAPSCP